MTTYRTGNPIGSKGPRDLYDNAENLDEAVNTRQAESWDDRFGVARKTWWGMEQDFQQFLLDSGYVNIGDYGPGLVITALNQIFWRDGELYRAGAVLELPYTTTGDWGDEEGLFVAVGDAALRQDLANPDKGAAMVARGVVAVDSIADLLSLPAGQRKEGILYLVSGFYPGNNEGGGTFRWVESADVSGHNGVTLIDPSRGLGWSGTLVDIESYFNPNTEGMGCFSRVGVYEVRTSWAGAVPSVEQDSKAAVVHAAKIATRLSMPLVNDVECFVSDGIVATTNVYCEKPISTGDSPNALMTLAPDNEVEILPELGVFSRLDAGLSRIPGLIGRTGQTITIYSDDLASAAAPGLNPYYKQSCHYVTSDLGHISPPLPWAYASGTITSVMATWSNQLGHEFRLRIRSIGSHTAPVFRNLVLSKISNAEFDNPVFENNSENFVPVSRGLVLRQSANVIISNPVMDGFHYEHAGYPIYVGVTCNIDILIPEITRSRKAIDGSFGNIVSIVGGSVTCPVGTHLGHNYTIRDTAITIVNDLFALDRPDPVFAYHATGDWLIEGIRVTQRGFDHPYMLRLLKSPLPLNSITIKNSFMWTHDCTGISRVLRWSHGVEDGSTTLLMPKKINIDNVMVRHDGGQDSLHAVEPDTFVNPIELPESIFISGTGGRIRMEILGVALSTRGTGYSYRFNDTHGCTLRVAGSHNIPLTIDNMTRGGGWEFAIVRLSPGVHPTVLMRGSVVDSVQHGQYGMSPVRCWVMLDTCQVSSLGGAWNFRLGARYQFDKSIFTGVVSWDQTEPVSDVVSYVAGCQGSTQPDFALNGVYELDV